MEFQTLKFQKSNIVGKCQNKILDKLGLSNFLKIPKTQLTLDNRPKSVSNRPKICYQGQKSKSPNNNNK